jgi:hypothetical protein
MENDPSALGCKSSEMRSRSTARKGHEGKLAQKSAFRSRFSCAEHGSSEPEGPQGEWCSRRITRPRHPVHDKIRLRCSAIEFGFAIRAHNSKTSESNMRGVV